DGIRDLIVTGVQTCALPIFDTVRQDGELQDITSLSNYFKAARAGELPAVSWLDPTGSVSEHPPGLVTAGQAYVTRLVNAAMRGRSEERRVGKERRSRSAPQQ